MESRLVADDHCPPAFKLLVSCPFGLSPSQLSVVFDPAYDRIPHPDTTLENSISEIWDPRVQQNPSLYNGLKFRTTGFFSGSEAGRSVHISRSFQGRAPSNHIDVQLTRGNGDEDEYDDDEIQP